MDSELELLLDPPLPLAPEEDPLSLLSSLSLLEEESTSPLALDRISASCLAASEMLTLSVLEVVLELDVESSSLFWLVMDSIAEA